MGALTQQSQLRFVEPRVSQAMNLSWNSRLQCWQLTLWKLRPAGGRRLRQSNAGNAGWRRSGQLPLEDLDTQSDPQGQPLTAVLGFVGCVSRHGTSARSESLVEAAGKP